MEQQIFILKTVRYHFPYIFFISFQTDFSILNISAYAIELRLTTTTNIFRKNKTRIYRTLNTSRTRYSIKRIVVIFFSQMMNEKNGNSKFISNVFENR